VVVLGVAHGHRLDCLGHVGVVGEPQHGDSLKSLLLERLQELGAHEDQALDQRLAGVGSLGGLQGAVEVVQDVDELEEKPLSPLVEAPLDVPGRSLPVALVVRLELAVGREYLLETVLGEARPAQVGLGGSGEPGGLEGFLQGKTRCLGLVGPRFLRLF
jgi:hypothetical protein